MSSRDVRLTEFIEHVDVGGILPKYVITRLPHEAVDPFSSLRPTSPTSGMLSDSFRRGSTHRGVFTSLHDAASHRIHKI